MKINVNLKMMLDIQREFPQHGHLSVGVEALPALVDVRIRSVGGG